MFATTTGVQSGLDEIDQSGHELALKHTWLSTHGTWGYSLGYLKRCFIRYWDRLPFPTVPRGKVQSTITVEPPNVGASDFVEVVLGQICIIALEVNINFGAFWGFYIS